MIETERILFDGRLRTQRVCVWLEPHLGGVRCARPLWSDGLLPAQDGSIWICGHRDQPRNFEAHGP